MDVFISHSSKDKVFAEYLVQLLQSALGLSDEQMRCTSVEKTQLSIGDDVEKTLKEDITGCKVFISILSPTSLNSTYVLFELGARWGTDEKILPLLLRSVDKKQIPAPLSSVHIAQGTKEGLLNLIREVGLTLKRKPKKSEYLRSEISALLAYDPPPFAPVDFAVLSYVLDKDLNFALLKDSYYKKIQPPGRRLLPNEYPHEVAHECASNELDLPRETLQRFPTFQWDLYDETDIVPPPYQVQIEKNPHRTALKHYDLVYVFFINRIRPSLNVRTSKEHKSDPDWYSIKKVEELKGEKEYGPHEDMIPTMKRIISDFRQEKIIDPLKNSDNSED